MASWLLKQPMSLKQLMVKGKWLMPTMVDLCARLREPGQQQHGTLKSEGRAARENGILHVFTLPDSKPIARQWCFDSWWFDGKSDVGWRYLS